MIQWLTTWISGIVGFFNQFLPDSPFSDFLVASEAMITGVKWLNFFVPVDDFCLIFLGYLAVLVIWAVVDFSIGKLGDGATSLIGGAS